MIYLAAPYSHPDEKITQARMELIYEAMYELMKRNEHVLTPLFMHEVVIRHKLPGDYGYWRDYCLDILGRCDKMIVLQLEGWEESRGVADEIRFCDEHGIPVEYMLED